MAKKHQPPMDVEQQIENLKSLDCIIGNEDKARDFLNNVSYFSFGKRFWLFFKGEKF